MMTNKKKSNLIFYSIVSLVCLVLSIWMVGIMSIKSTEKEVLIQENGALNHIISSQELNPSAKKSIEFSAIQKINAAEKTKKNLFISFIVFYLLCVIGFLCFRYCDRKRELLRKNQKKE